MRLPGLSVCFPRGNSVCPEKITGRRGVPMPPTLSPGGSMVRGDWLYSNKGNHCFGLQGNGCICLFMLHPKNGVLWKAEQYWSGQVLRMQDDGNLVIYDYQNSAVWASNTAGYPGSVLRLEDDGNLLIYAPGTRPIWATGTSGHEPRTYISPPTAGWRP